MGTTSKIIGTLATAIDKVSGTAISGLANIMGQIISLYSDSAYVGEFDGSDDYVDCGNDSSIRPTAALTYNSWVWRADWNDNVDPQVIMGNFRAASGVKIRWKNKRIQGFARVDGTNRQVQTGWNKFKSGKPYYRASGWHMISMTWDGQYLTLYIDGALANQGGTTTVDVGSSGNVIDYSTGNYDINIGQQVGIGGTTFYEGRIDECAIWDVALDADAIAELWDQDGGTVKPSNLNADKDNYDNSGDLQGWWRFEENTGTSIADSSGNGNTGTLTNGVAFNSDTPD